jgi:acyl-CoA dehydrogenase
MRCIGSAERAMELMVERALKRTVFGKTIAEHGSFLSDLAKVTFLSVENLLIQ